MVRSGKRIFGKILTLMGSDYDVFLSPLNDFKKEVTKAGLQDKVVYLERGDAFKFEVKMQDSE